MDRPPNHLDSSGRGDLDCRLADGPTRQEMGSQEALEGVLFSSRGECDRRFVASTTPLFPYEEEEGSLEFEENESGVPTFPIDPQHPVPVEPRVPLSPLEPEPVIP